MKENLETTLFWDHKKNWGRFGYCKFVNYPCQRMIDLLLAVPRYTVVLLAEFILVDVLQKNWAIHGLFFFIFVFSIDS